MARRDKQGQEIANVMGAEDERDKDRIGSWSCCGGGQGTEWRVKVSSRRSEAEWRSEGSGQRALYSVEEHAEWSWLGQNRGTAREYEAK